MLAYLHFLNSFNYFKYSKKILRIWNYLLHVLRMPDTCQVRVITGGQGLIDIHEK